MPFIFFSWSKTPRISRILTANFSRNHDRKNFKIIFLITILIKDFSKHIVCIGVKYLASQTGITNISNILLQSRLTNTSTCLRGEENFSSILYMCRYTVPKIDTCNRFKILFHTMVFTQKIKTGHSMGIKRRGKSPRTCCEEIYPITFIVIFHSWNDIHSQLSVVS